MTRYIIFTVLGILLGASASAGDTAQLQHQDRNLKADEGAGTSARCGEALTGRDGACRDETQSAEEKTRALFRQALARCDTLSGNAKAACTAEARLKYGQ